MDTVDKTQEAIKKLLDRRQEIINFANAQINEINLALSYLGYQDQPAQPQPQAQAKAKP